MQQIIDDSLKTIALPFGSTEQHGPHLPVGTDTMVAMTLAEEIESSHMMYRYPDMVKIDRAIDNPHPENKLYSVDPSFEGDTLCYVPSSPKEMKEFTNKSGGTTGEPSKATIKGGEQYHNHLVSRLVEVIQGLQRSK